MFPVEHGPGTNPRMEHQRAQNNSKQQQVESSEPVLSSPSRNRRWRFPVVVVGIASIRMVESIGTQSCHDWESKNISRGSSCVLWLCWYQGANARDHPGLGYLPDGIDSSPDLDWGHDSSVVPTPRRKVKDSWTDG